MYNNTKKSKIIDAGLLAAQDLCLNMITRGDVAKRAGCAPSLISHFFGDMETFKIALIERAIELPDLTVLAQGLVMKMEKAHCAPLGLKNKALKHLAQWRN